MMAPMQDPANRHLATVWTMVIRSLLLKHRDELVEEFPILKEGFESVYGGGNMLTLKLAGSKVLHLYVVSPRE